MEGWLSFTDTRPEPLSLVSYQPKWEPLCCCCRLFMNKVKARSQSLNWLTFATNFWVILQYTLQNKVHHAPRCRWSLSQRFSFPSPIFTFRPAPLLPLHRTPPTINAPVSTNTIAAGAGGNDGSIYFNAGGTLGLRLVGEFEHRREEGGFWEKSGVQERKQWRWHALLHLPHDSPAIEHEIQQQRQQFRPLRSRGFLGEGSQHHRVVEPKKRPLTS